jgi:hypothetical protein
MRRCAGWLLVTGCGAFGGRPSDNANDASTVFEDAYEGSSFDYPRSATAVIVGDARIVWSRGQTICADPIRSTECPPPGATVLTSTTPTAKATVWAETRLGVDIVGDENEVFFINSDDYLNGFVVRVRPTSNNTYPQAMNIPRPYMGGLAVDATHVYWCDGGLNGSPKVTRRALRSGDGSDVEVVAPGCGEFVFGGYLFAGSTRVPVTGGTFQPFTAETNWGIFARSNDLLYVKQYIPPNGYRTRISTMTVDGVMQTLLDDIPQYEAPHSRGVFSDGELFWTTGLSKLYRMPATGGTPTVIGTLDPLQAFGVTNEAILFDFNLDGYKTMPR